MPYSELKIVGPFTTVERDALVNVPQYFMIFNSTTNQFEFWDGSGWQTVPSNDPIFATLAVLGGATLGGSMFHTHAVVGNFIIYTQLQMNASRLRLAQGADVSSANDLTFPTVGGAQDGNSFEVTGATQINAIKTANWQDGSIVTLLFTSTPTVKHNTAGGAGTVPVLLDGTVDFIAAAGDRLVLELSDIGGTQAWREIGRSLVAATQTYTETNVTTDRSFDANATSLDEIADVLGSLIADLRAKRIVL